MRLDRRGRGAAGGLSPKAASTRRALGSGAHAGQPRRGLVGGGRDVWIGQRCIDRVGQRSAESPRSFQGSDRSVRQVGLIGHEHGAQRHQRPRWRSSVTKVRVGAESGSQQRGSVAAEHRDRHGQYSLQPASVGLVAMTYRNTLSWRNSPSGLRSASSTLTMVSRTLSAPTASMNL